VNRGTVNLGTRTTVNRTIVNPGTRTTLNRVNRGTVNLGDPHDPHNREPTPTPMDKKNPR